MVKIELSDPWVDSARGGERPPLSTLRYPHDHIHGKLSFSINGRLVPGLGYFGPGDVCVGMWLKVLLDVKRELSASDGAKHVFDEMEEGQPAYQFTRDGDEITVTIVASLADGSGLPEWGTQRCKLLDFVSEVDGLALSLKQKLANDAPGLADRWWNHRFKR